MSFKLFSILICFVSSSAFGAMSLRRSTKPGQSPVDTISISSYDKSADIFNLVQVETTEACHGGVATPRSCQYSKSVQAGDINLTWRGQSFSVTLPAGRAQLSQSDRIRWYLPAALAKAIPFADEGGIRFLSKSNELVFKADPELERGSLKCEQTSGARQCFLELLVGREIQNARDKNGGQLWIQNALVYRNSDDNDLGAVIDLTTVPLPAAKSRGRFSDLSEIRFIHPAFEADFCNPGFGSQVRFCGLRREGFHLVVDRVSELMSLALFFEKDSPEVLNGSVKIPTMEGIFTSYQLSALEKIFAGYTGPILETEKIKVDALNGSITSQLSVF